MTKANKVVRVTGFFVVPSQTSPSNSKQPPHSEYASMSVSVHLPGDWSSLDCQWLMEAAGVEFSKAGVTMRVVGLIPCSLESTPATGQRSSVGDTPCVPWMIDPSMKLDNLDLANGLEAVFMRDELSISSGNTNNKIGASDFDFIRLLGEGATCKVFQVRRKKTGKMYAVKVMGKDRILGNHRKIEQALTERKVLVEVRHPFIVQLHWTFQTRSHLYFVLEFCPGGELFFHLQKRGRFPDDIAKFYFAEVLLGLEYLHNRNIIYRDLKLENILLDDQGHIRLTDFGVSKVAPQEDVKFTSVVGTREYFSPEMIKREGYGKPYDFYCLGCVLYIMLTGTLPYFQGNWSEMYQKRLNGAILQFPKGVPREAMDLCSKLLDRDPKTRIGSNGGAEEIRQHPWLADMDWEKLYSKEITPPIDPKANSDNFDPVFTQKALAPQMIGIDQSASGMHSTVEGAATKLPLWSFSEGVDKSSFGHK
jgi:serine/threonine protein kinase